MQMQDKKYREVFWEMRIYKTKATQIAAANEEIRSSKVMKPYEGCGP